MEQKIILHLCADIGSDSFPYSQDENYRVVLIGKNYGVENLTKEKLLKDFNIKNVQGIIANPECLELSCARSGGKARDIKIGLFLVIHCLRIISEVQPKWWVIENPANGVLRDYLGKPKLVYQPYEYGSGWTKKTALWGNFRLPEKKYQSFIDCPKTKGLYVRTKRDDKPSLAFQHKRHIRFIDEFQPFADKVKTDSDLRSLCSQKFAQAFKAVNA